MKPYPTQSLSVKFNRNHYKRFPCCTTPSFAGLFSSNKGFILNSSVKSSISSLRSRQSVVQGHWPGIRAPFKFQLWRS
jgi:hypothetical protein